MIRPPLAAALFAVLAVAAAPELHAEPADTGTTLTFPYAQRRLLYSRNGAGGLAYIAPGADRGASLPVVVFLHGTNPEAQLHPWFGGALPDLRAVVQPLVTSGAVTPFVLAAPTHSRFATGATVMWPRFDLPDFLDATEAALGGRAHLDRTRVIVVGTSAAGCNPGGGLFSEGVRAAKPFAVVAIDTCLDARVEEPLTALATTTPVRFYWQRGWRRPIEDLASRCDGCLVEELSDLGRDPHTAIVPAALRRALLVLLPRP